MKSVWTHFALIHDIQYEEKSGLILCSLLLSAGDIIFSCVCLNWVHFLDPPTVIKWLLSDLFYPKLVQFFTSTPLSGVSNSDGVSKHLFSILRSSFRSSNVFISQAISPPVHLRFLFKSSVQPVFSSFPSSFLSKFHFSSSGPIKRPWKPFSHWLL